MVDKQEKPDAMRFLFKHSADLEERSRICVEEAELRRVTLADLLDHSEGLIEYCQRLTRGDLKD